MFIFNKIYNTLNYLTTFVYQKTKIVVDDVDAVEGTMSVTDGWQYNLKTSYDTSFVYKTTYRYNPYSRVYESYGSYEPNNKYITKYEPEPKYKYVKTHHGVIINNLIKYTIYIYQTNYNEALNYMRLNFNTNKSYNMYTYFSLIKTIESDGKKYWMV